MMKNSAFCFLVVGLMFNYGCLSQGHLLGIRAGYGKSIVLAEKFPAITHERQSFSMGVSYDKLKHLFSYGADLMYQKRGFNADWPAVDARNVPSSSELVTLDYISLPLRGCFNYLWRFGYNNGLAAGLFVTAGMVPSYLLASRTTANYAFGSYRYEYHVSNIRRFDLGAQGEVGAGFLFLKRYWLIGSLIYQRSLTSFAAIGYFEDSDFLNTSTLFCLSLRYEIPAK